MNKKIFLLCFLVFSPIYDSFIYAEKASLYKSTEREKINVDVSNYGEVAAKVAEMKAQGWEFYAIEKNPK